MHRRAGVVLVEVKATEKFKSNRYLDAKKQLDVAEKVIRALLNAIGITLPVYKVVAMPNVADPGRDVAGYIDLRKQHLVLGDKDSDDVRLLVRWWKEHFCEMCFDEVGDTLLKFISILVGQRAAISATANILAGVSKTIDEQSFLERSYAKLAKKGERGSKMVVKPTVKTGLGILAKQFMFLNREQLHVWEGPRLQIIMGSPGSGKTILLQFKALECAKKNEQVLVVVPSPLDKLYTEFFTRNGLNSGITVVITFHQLADFLSKEAEVPTDPFHVFVDEFPALFFEENNSELLESFRDFLSKHQHQWIVEDSEQLLLADRFESFEREQDMHTRIDPIQISLFCCLLCKDKNFVFSTNLVTIMRYTNEIYNFLIKHYYQLSSVIKLTIDMSNHDDFNIDQTVSKLQIGHNICGPQVIEERRTYKTSKERLHHCLQVINSELNEWLLQDDEEKPDFCKVAILVNDQNGLMNSLHT